MMAKRACPYTEDFVPQSKVHVGLRQFNNNEYRLKSVHEKTLKLLFKGANKIPLSKVTNRCSIDVYSKNGKDKMKQLFIGKDGSLMRSGNMVPDKNLSAQLCSCGNTAMDSHCVYCEVALCDSCQHHCVRCDGDYCSRCSLIGSEDSTICVSCYN